MWPWLYFFFFFFNDTATTEIYPLPLHAALPILEHRQVREAASDDLEADRQSGLRESGRNRRGGLAREVEGIAERGPADPVPRLRPPGIRVQAPDRERGDGQRRRQKEVEPLEEWPHGVPVRELLAPRLDVVNQAVAQPVLDACDEPRVHAATPLGKILSVIAGLVSAPETPDQVVRVGETGLDFLDDAAEILERPNRLSHHGGDRSEERRVGKECRSRWSP